MLATQTREIISFFTIDEVLKPTCSLRRYQTFLRNIPNTLEDDYDPSSPQIYGEVMQKPDIPNETYLVLGDVDIDFQCSSVGQIDKDLRLSLSFGELLVQQDDPYSNVIVWTRAGPRETRLPLYKLKQSRKKKYFLRLWRKSHAYGAREKLLAMHKNTLRESWNTLFPEFKK